jgi:hypothetical protein
MLLETRRFQHPFAWLNWLEKWLRLVLSAFTRALCDPASHSSGDSLWPVAPDRKSQTIPGILLLNGIIALHWPKRPESRAG